jgi:hypothetical protein
MTWTDSIAWPLEFIHFMVVELAAPVTIDYPRKYF